MLNLSDKDLDRLSQEAAQQYEPEDIGSKLWEKLEARLDRDLGKVNLNPARGIRRLPYFYAPVLLLILGVGYYFVRLNNKFSKGTSSGSPPVTLAKPFPTGQSDATGPAATATNPATDATNPATDATSSSTNPAQSDKQNSTSAVPSHTVPYSSTTGVPAPSSASTAEPAVTSRASHNDKSAALRPEADEGAISSASAGVSPSTRSPQHLANSGHLRDPRHTGAPGSSCDAISLTTRGTNHITPVSASAASDLAAAPSASTNTNAVRDLNYSAVRGPIALTTAPAIDDSALRAFNLNSLQPSLARKDGLHINRALILGVLGAPDFASVNSIAGDRAGSSFGVTVDYEFANHWYLGSGLLYSRRIFAAAPQDYHVPQDYYRQNGMGMGNSVQWIKGRFDMLEIPLDLRYDFSTTGNTLFFVSAGASSYLFTRENCGYYYEFYNRILSKQFNYGNDPSNLFSTLNFSVGVETGISNSMSVLVSPYVKIPTRNFGFGQVQLNSFGIDFALRFAPILSRRR